MIYPKEKSAEISFPLGGIGTGCVGLAGNGRLIDWELFNAPGKGRDNGMSHFAIRTERAGKVVDCRILTGDLPGPYSGEWQYSGGLFRGFGWGPTQETLCGLPHFSGLWEFCPISSSLPMTHPPVLVFEQLTTCHRLGTKSQKVNLCIRICSKFPEIFLKHTKNTSHYLPEIIINQKQIPD